MTKKYLGPKRHLSSVGPDVVHLWLFAVLSEVRVGVAVQWWWLIGVQKVVMPR
jgi:hypothetical protein